MQEKQLLIIVPAYNESQVIENVIHELKHVDLSLKNDILVINDCSTDGTRQILEELKVSFLNLPVNLGIGGAVQSGFIYAFQNNYDYLVQIDGDGQHPATNIQNLIDIMHSSGSDIIIGSRFLLNKGFQSSLSRRLGINFFKFIIRLLCKINITDSTSGLRLYNRKAIEIAANNYPDEYPEPESVIMFHLLKLKIYEIPVEMRERSTGKSSIGRFISVYYMFKVTLSMLFTYIRIKHFNYD